MRIVHVIGTLDPAAGGPPMVASRLAAAQAALGHHVRVVCYLDTTEQERIEESLLAVPGFAAVRMHAIDAGGLTERYTGTQAGRHVRTLLEGRASGCVVHLHGVWEPMLRSAALAARRCGTPYVLSPHGMLDPWSLRQRCGKKKLALALGVRTMLNRASFLHVLNEDERTGIQPLGLTPPTQVIPNGVFLEEIDPLPPLGKFRSRVEPLGDAPFVLFVSRLHPKKGLDRLARALARLLEDGSPLHLVVAGPDGGAEAEFRRMVTDLNLQDRVHLVGPLWGRDKVAAMVDATCFCLPSRQEGFSVAVTEAMASGAAVVISEACHFPEVAACDAGRVVRLEDQDAEADAAALAAALDEVTRDPVLARRMGQAGRTLVQHQFTWPGIAAAMVAAYETCVVEPQPVAPAGPNEGQP